jgi:hypothetical protein
MVFAPFAVRFPMIIHAAVGEILHILETTAPEANIFSGVP